MKSDSSQVRDNRDDRGKRWDLGALLHTVLGAMLAGARSLADVEEMTERMSSPMKRLFGIQRRVPDTTLRDVLCTIDPYELRSCLHTIVHQAQRRKAFEPSALPFGVVSLDGKAFSIPATDDWYAQRQTSSEDGPLVGVVRSVTSTLTSHQPRPVIDATTEPQVSTRVGRCATLNCRRMVVRRMVVRRMDGAAHGGAEWKFDDSGGWRA